MIRRKRKIHLEISDACTREECKATLIFAFLLIAAVVTWGFMK